MNCAHCGFPVRRAPRVEPVYCCLGCSILGSVGDGPMPARESRALTLRLGLAAFFSANTMMLSLFLYSLERPGATAPEVALALVRALLLLFSLPAFALLAPPFVRGLGRDVRRLRFSTESLIAIGAGAAFVYSTISVVRGSNRVYFDTATGVLLLVTAGRLLEAHARVRGTRALRELIALRPTEARVKRDGQWRTLPVDELTRTDRVQVRAGERIPVDGTIVDGGAAIDESMLTGEPLPAERGVNDLVRAGSLCLNGVLEVAPAGPAADSLLDRIIGSVEQARQARSPLERLADRAAAIFVPATVLLAMAVSASGHMLNGLAVLVVACPCALGIAVPMVSALALAAAARAGILVRSAEAMEALATVDTLALDKTGTVTTGQARVSRVLPAEGVSEESALAVAAAAAADSTHPVARAVEAAAMSRGVIPLPRRAVEVLPGKGVRAELEDGTEVLLGQSRWLTGRTDGLTWCRHGGRVIGAFALDDPVRPDARSALVDLRSLGLDLILLSGDRSEAVAEVAGDLGIRQAEGGLLPEEKAVRIRELRKGGRRVAMAGDGINDAPALASADVGMAVSGGTDVARETAEVVFLKGGLSKLPRIFRLARRARRISMQNLAWAFSYNVVALALAATGALRPILAALIMFVSSILVISNSLRLVRERSS